MNRRIYPHLLEMVERLAALRADQPPRSEIVALRAQLESLRSRLRGTPVSDLAPDTRIEQVGIAVCAALLSIELDPAIKALATLAGLDLEKSGLSPRAAELNLKIAQRQLMAALPHAAALPDREDSAAAETMPAGSDAPAAVSNQGPPPDLQLLRNIATYHREHERYHACGKMQEAAELCLQSNRLKTLTNVWLERVSPAAYAADYADPRYQAAGCDDLNALDAIAGIGVLFMEGEREPGEITAIKARLLGQSQAWIGLGQWLAAKMEAAWERESVLYQPEWIDCATARYGTIVTNWRGSREMELSGRCLSLASKMLQAIDFRPGAVRANRAAAGESLRTACWVMDQASQITARSAADLQGNDIHWTRYLQFLSSHEKAA